MIFLTGATGLVGSEFLCRALSCGVPVTALVRSAGRRVNTDVVHGDLSCFDLDPRQITAILHCAAETRFGLPIDKIRITNVEGTRRLIEFARRCPKLEKFGHLSTAFTCGRSEGRLTETRWKSAMFSNTYQQSKWEAEELVFDAMRDIPAAIYRLSSIIGNSRTGSVRQFNYTHRLMRLFPLNLLPVTPGIPDAPVDLIATDWVGDTLFHLFTNRFTAGKVFHLCAGPERSITVQEMIDRARREFESHPNGQRWLPICPPRLVNLEEYAAFVEEVNRSKDRLLKEMIRVLDFFLPHLALHQAFDTANTQAAAPEMKPPAIRDYFTKMVSYCLETDWGRSG